jgi:hypothetical protein
MDGQGYDVTMRMWLPSSMYHIVLTSEPIPVGQHRVLSGQKVFINDPALLGLPGFSKSKDKERKLAVQLNVRIGDSDVALDILASTALFGADPGSERSPGTFRVGAPALHVVPASPENLNGCAPHTPQPTLEGAVLVVNRGKFFNPVGVAGVLSMSSRNLHFHGKTWKSQGSRFRGGHSDLGQREPNKSEY